MRKKQKTIDPNLLPWGILLLLVGLNLLFSELKMVPKELGSFLFNWKHFFLYTGITFVFCYKDKTVGVLLLFFALINYLLMFVQWKWSAYVWPPLLTLSGASLLIYYMNKKK